MNWNDSLQGGERNGGRRRAAAFSLVEVLAVVVILGILFGVAMPAWEWALEKSNGRKCGANLLVLENAKDSFRLDSPGGTLSFPTLKAYIRGAETLPDSFDFVNDATRPPLLKCPSIGGGLYSNLVESSLPCKCSLNGQNGDVDKNGIHDLGL